MHKRPLTKSYTLYDKGSQETRNTRDVPQHSKVDLQKAHSHQQLKWRENQNISIKVRNKAELSFLIPIQYSTLSLN